MLEPQTVKRSCRGSGDGHLEEIVGSGDGIGCIQPVGGGECRRRLQYIVTKPVGGPRNDGVIARDPDAEQWPRQQAIDIQSVREGRQIHFAIGHSRRTKLGKVPDGIAGTDLLGVPKFGRDTLGIVRAQDAGADGLVSVARILMGGPQNSSAGIGAVGGDGQDSAGHPVGGLDRALGIVREKEFSTRPVKFVLVQVIVLTPDVRIGAVWTIPPNRRAVDIVGIAQSGDLEALHDVRVGSRRAAEAAHIVAVHQIELAFLAARQRESRSGNEQDAARA